MTLPYTERATIWSAKAATETAVIPDSLVRRCPIKVIEIITTGFSGTLDIQGRIMPTTTLDNASYVLLGQGAAQTPSNAQLSWTTNTSRYRYLVTEPYMDMSLVMTRTAGSITLHVGGWGLSGIAAGAGTLFPGTGATNLGKAEDAAHASGDVGVQMLAVRKDTAAALAGTDADYAPLEVDASGRLHVSLSAITTNTDSEGVDLCTNMRAWGASANVLAAAVPDNADGVAATSGSLPRVQAREGLFNGSTWDRARSIASSGAGLGVAQVGTLGELITLAASAARTDSANGTAVTGLGWRNRYIVLFDLTVADTDAGDTLDVYVDVSLDGNTWLNAVHFTQIVGTDSASKRYAVLDPAAPGTSEILVTSDAAAGVVRPSMFGAQMRARWAIVDAGTDDASFTFSVTAYAI